jgi:hypothetical protein
MRTALGIGSVLHHIQYPARGRIASARDRDVSSSVLPHRDTGEGNEYGCQGDLLFGHRVTRWLYGGGNEERVYQE